MAKAVVARGRKFRIERDPAWEPGRHEATFTIHDLHYKDAADQWQEVNESLTDDGADGFAKKCDTTQHALRLGNGGTRRWYPRRNVSTEYVEITAIEYYDNRWRNLNLPTPAWRAQGADWDLANLSASITNTWKRIKTDFVLKDATAPTGLRFAVTLVGLTLGGDWQLRTASDEIVGLINPPTAEDATGAAVPVTATYAGGYIEWAVDVTGATFPVTVDPTFTDGYGGDVTTAMDLYVASDGPTTLTGNMTTVQFNGTSRKVLLKFDVSSLSGATINSATLSLWGSEVQYWSSTTMNWYAIASGNDGWVEYDAIGASCWSYKNSNGSVAWAGSAGLSTAGTDYVNSVIASRAFSANEAWTDSERTFSVSTSQIATWAGGSNYGMVGWQTGYTGAHSSDASTTSYRPKLVVDYTAGGEPPLTITITDDRHYINVIRTFT